MAEQQLNLTLYKEGLLEKRGLSKFLWKKYWCILNGNIFKCYQLKEAITNSLEKVAINMNEVQTVKKISNIDHGYPFEFTTKLKTVIWSAESESLREEWIKNLQQSIVFKIFDNRLSDSRISENSQILTLYASLSTLDNKNPKTCSPYEVVDLNKFLDKQRYEDSSPHDKVGDDDDGDDGQVILRNNPIYQETYKHSNIYEDITVQSDKKNEPTIVSECWESQGSSLADKEESESPDDDGSEACHSFIFESQFENSPILNDMSISSQDVDIFSPHPYITTDMCPRLEELKKFLNEMENKSVIKADENQLTTSTYDDLNDCFNNETAILEIQKFLAAIELENKS